MNGRLKGLAALLLAALLLCACSGVESTSQAASAQADGSATDDSGALVLQPAASDVAASSEIQAEPQPTEHRVRFSAVGDNLIHNSIYESAREQTGGSGYDFTFAYENIRYFFEDFDVNWMNQETLVNNELEPATYPCFSTPGELGQATYDAGWRVFALSNNHTYDKGSAGIAATRKYWSEMPDDVVTYGLFTGIDDDSGIAVQEVNGLSIAYVAFTENTNGLPTPQDTEAFVIYTSDYSAMETKVRRAREMADVLVVSVHWGVENSHNVVQGQRTLAQDFANWGADVVIGTHPHVVQEIEWIESDEGKDVLVAYSLGNFLSAQSQPNQLFGLILAFDLVMTEDVDGSKSPLQIENVRALPTITQYEYPGGSHYVNPRTYLYRDYTDELAAKHRVRTVEPSFGREYVEKQCREYISDEFLDFT